MEKILFDTPMTYPNRKGKWSHLVAPNIKSLHAFADKIGLKRHWFQNKKKKKQPHYDLPEYMVEAAKNAGAIQVQRKEVYQFLKENYS